MSIKKWTYFRYKRKGKTEYGKTEGHVFENVWINEDTGDVSLRFDARLKNIPERYKVWIYTRVTSRVINQAKLVM